MFGGGDDGSRRPGATREAGRDRGGRSGAPDARAEPLERRLEVLAELVLGETGELELGLTPRGADVQLPGAAATAQPPPLGRDVDGVDLGPLQAADRLAVGAPEHVEPGVGQAQ